MRFTFFLLYLLIANVFLPSCVKGIMQEKDPLDISIDIVINNTLNQLKKKHNLYSFGKGASTNIHDKITALSIVFETSYLIDIDEARAIVLDCAATFISNINNDKFIRPFLQDYPFNEKDIEIGLFIKDENNCNAIYPNPCMIRCSEGFIQYYAYNPKNPYTSESIHKETYEEARKKVAKNGS